MKKQNHNNVSKRCLEICLAMSIAFLTIIVTVQVVNKGQCPLAPIASPKNAAVVETWREQNLWDILIGNGIHQTGTLYRIEPLCASTISVYENMRPLLTTSNYSSVVQNAEYSYSETKGFVVDVDVKEQLKHFEVAFGFSINVGKTTSYKAYVNVPSGKHMEVWGADNRIKRQYSDYCAQKQKYLLTKGWVNTGTPYLSSPLVKQYGAYHVEWRESPIDDTQTIFGPF